MNLDATISKEEGWKRTISVSVPVTEVESAFSAVTQKYRQKAKIPGFRPGKAPLEMVNRQFGSDIRQDVLEAMIPRAFDAALNKLSLSPLGTPELSSVKFERGQPLEFEANFEIRPQVEVTGYNGLSLTKRVYTVTDQDIDAAVESLQDGAATTIEVQRPAREGDVVVCNFQKIHDRLNRVTQSQYDGLRVELQENRTRTELFKNLIGMSLGEAKEIEIAYSADEGDPELAGNTVLYRVWVKQVLQKQLPPADDSLAKLVSGGKIESLSNLRETIGKDIAARAENAALRDIRGQIRQKVVSANPVDVPEGFMHEHLEEVTEKLRARDQSVTPEAVRAQFEPMAIEQFRWDYAVAEIARKESIEVSDGEVESVVKSWPKDARDNPDPSKIHWSMLERKVYDWVMDRAQISEEPYQPQSRIITP